MVTCYRHPDRRAGVSCQRCNRPICPSCMVQASVGFHCPECAQRGAQQVVTPDSLTKRPIVTIVLIAVNVVAFVAQVATSTSTANLLNSSNLSGGVSEQGWLVATGDAVRGAGFEWVPTVGVAAGEWWRIVTSGFLHGGLIHLAMNMVVLWIIGSQLEPALGRARYLALYVTGLVAGAFGVLLISPQSVTVGASGAVFALFGAAFAFQRSRGINPMTSGLGGLLVLNLVISFLPGISFGGHLGGFVGGLLAGWLIFDLDKRIKSAWAGVAACAAITVVLFAGCIWAASQWADPVLGFLDFWR